MDGLIEDYAAQWRRCGLCEGDVVLLHSAMKPTLLRDRDRLKDIDVARVLFESFRRAVGTSGTVVFPTFTFDFSNGLPYDNRNSPSQMGALSEYARRQAAFRTGHAVYSFVAFGPDASRFHDYDNKSAYGEDSPFEMLKTLDAKIAVLNLPDQNSMTFYHHVEQVMSVPYRYHKDFTKPYTDAKGVTAERTYSIFVRDLAKGVKTDVNSMGDRLWALGIYSGNRPTEGCGLRTAKARAIFEAVAEIIRKGKAEGMLFSLAGVSA